MFLVIHLFLEKKEKCLLLASRECSSLPDIGNKCYGLPFSVESAIITRNKNPKLINCHAMEGVMFVCWAVLKLASDTAQPFQHMIKRCGRRLQRRKIQYSPITCLMLMSIPQLNLFSVAVIQHAIHVRGNSAFVAWTPCGNGLPNAASIRKKKWWMFGDFLAAVALAFPEGAAIPNALSIWNVTLSHASKDAAILLVLWCREAYCGRKVIYAVHILVKMTWHKSWQNVCRQNTTHQTNLRGFIGGWYGFWSRLNVPSSCNRQGQCVSASPVCINICST